MGNQTSTQKLDGTPLNTKGTIVQPRLTPAGTANALTIPTTPDKNVKSYIVKCVGDNKIQVQFEYNPIVEKYESFNGDNNQMLWIFFLIILIIFIIYWMKY